MKVCVQGLWHLGSVTAACLASIGHHVIGLDTDPIVVKQLNQGKAPLFEPGLDALLSKGIQEGTLSFTTDVAEALSNIDVLWVTFDTPVDSNDIAEVGIVLDHIKNTLPLLSNGAIVLISSQLPVGSIAKLEQYAKEHLPEKTVYFACTPENLRLGQAINIFLNPDRIVLGTRNDEIHSKLNTLLLPITNKLEWMSIESAEMTKHAINAFLATSITFANEIASICELVGADAKEVERGLKTEHRIGPKAYLSPGSAFAGGTLARDVAFLNALGTQNNLTTPLMSSIRVSNNEHKNWVRRKLRHIFSDLKDTTIAVWGLTYKPGTNTLRCSLAVALCDWLIEQGAKIRVYDPLVHELPAHWSHKVRHCHDGLEAITGAQAVILGTPRPEFIQEAEHLFLSADPNLVVIDAERHLIKAIAPLGLPYFSVGSTPKKSECLI